MATTHCAQCGKKVNGKGLIFDGIDIFCDYECAVKFFDNDEGCVDILIDAGRLVWEE